MNTLHLPHRTTRCAFLRDLAFIAPLVWHGNYAGARIFVRLRRCPNPAAIASAGMFARLYAPYQGARV